MNRAPNDIPEDPPPRLAFEGYELDLATYQLNQHGKAVHVQPKILDLLIYLARHRGRVVSREELFEEVWDGVMVSDSALSYAISMVRRAVGDDGSGQAVIATVRGRGYRFVAPARIVLRKSVASRDHGISSLPFVGGERVLALLEAEFANSKKGRGRAVLLAGEPGIGKSRTIAEFSHRVQATGVSILSGRCVEGEGAPAFWPWLQILRAAIQRGLVGSEQRERMSIIALALPELRDVFESELTAVEDDPRGEPARFHVFELIEEVVRDICASHSLIITIDDLHNADQGSLRLLEHLLRSLGQRSLFVVGAYRDASIRPDSPESKLLASVARAPGVVHAQVQALSSENVARLMEGATGQRPIDAWVSSVHERTGGNPFFLTQMLQLWGDDAANPRTTPLPPLVQEAIRQHLDALPEDCRELLSLASVFGREFDLAILSAAADILLESLVDVLESAVQARVLQPIPDTVTRYQFSHALIQETLYELLPSPLRLSAHDRVARAFEYDGRVDRRRVVELAHHAYRAAPRGGWERAVRCCEASARTAMQQLAYEDAATEYERALDALGMGNGDDERRLELTLALARARFRSGEFEVGRRTVLEAASIARKKNLAGWLARAALEINGDYDDTDGVGTSDSTRIFLLREAMAVLGPGLGSLHVRVRAALAEALVFDEDSEQMNALGLEAIAMARTLGDPMTLSRALTSRHLTLRTPRGLAERCAISRECAELAPEIHDVSFRSDTYSFALIDALEQGDISVVDDCLEAVQALADQSRQPFYRWFAGLYSGMRSLLAGRVDAEPIIERTYQIGLGVRKDAAELLYAHQLHLLRIDQGREAEMLETMGKMASRYPLPPVRMHRVWLEAMCGDPKPAQREIDSHLQRGLSSIRFDMLWLEMMYSIGEVAVLIQHEDAAKAVYGVLSPYADHHVMAGPALAYRGCVAATLGRIDAMLGRWKAASDHFQVAIDRQCNMGAWPYVTGTHLSWAQMLTREGRAETADQVREHLREASALARNLGLRRYTRLAKDLASAA